MAKSGLGKENQQGTGRDTGIHKACGRGRREYLPKFSHRPTQPNPTQPSLPVKQYRPNRSWFTEDFAFEWNKGLWEVKTSQNPEYHLWEKSEPGAFVEKGTNVRGYPTYILNFSRLPGEGPSVCLRLSEKVGWDSYFLKYYYRPIGDEPFELSPLCLDLPEGTRMETISRRPTPNLSKPRRPGIACFCNTFVSGTEKNGRSKCGAT